MGFGGTTQKLQKVASMAEDVYAKLNELRDQINALRETVDRMDRRTAENRALLEALAAEEGVDVDAVLTETAIEEAEDVESTTESAGETSDAADTTGGTTDGAATESAASESSTDTTTADTDGTDGTTGTDDTAPSN
ncbi:DUF5798 family protein [Halomarina rubra]|uniref:DUF5798 family protein n=1 Tax=Halomarina rubra TaxID=2071873 RepID=A0ABD6AQD1_9EURY|nr:DUF5798 family protein [Halomarina rubra]